MRAIAIGTLAVLLALPAFADQPSVLSGSVFSQGDAQFSLFDVRAPLPGDTCQEWRNTGQVPYDCGAHAKAATLSLVLGGHIECVDRPGGTKSCYVDGEDVAMTLVRRGWALSCRASGRYDAAERDAREAQLGIWSGSFRISSRCP